MSSIHTPCYICARANVPNISGPEPAVCRACIREHFYDEEKTDPGIGPQQTPTIPGYIQPINLDDTPF